MNGSELQFFLEMFGNRKKHVLFILVLFSYTTCLQDLHIQTRFVFKSRCFFNRQNVC